MIRPLALLAACAAVCFAALVGKPVAAADLNYSETTRYHRPHEVIYPNYRSRRTGYYVDYVGIDYAPLGYSDSDLGRPNARHYYSYIPPHEVVYESANYPITCYPTQMVFDPWYGWVWAGCN